MKILINNKFVSAKNAKISVFSDAFQFGFGVFETILIQNDKKITGKSAQNGDMKHAAKIAHTVKTPHLSKNTDAAHIKRLRNSAQEIGVRITYKNWEICEMINKILDKSGPNPQRLKIIAIPEKLILISTPLPKTSQNQPVRLKSIFCERSLPHLKTLSYLDSYLAHQKAINEGYDDALLIDRDGYVTEAAHANIFWFEGETLCTREKNVLPGITRDQIIKFSPFPIKFKKIKLAELLKKEEIFITNSIKGLMPVIQIDKKRIGKGKIGKKTAQIIQLYRKMRCYGQIQNKCYNRRRINMDYGRSKC